MLFDGLFAAYIAVKYESAPTANLLAAVLGRRFGRTYKQLVKIYEVAARAYNFEGCAGMVLAGEDAWREALSSFALGNEQRQRARRIQSGEEPVEQVSAEWVHPMPANKEQILSAVLAVRFLLCNLIPGT